MTILPFPKPPADPPANKPPPEPARTREGLSLTIRLNADKLLAAIAKLRKEPPT